MIKGKFKISIAFFDVDGVLTDGTKNYYQDGSVSKSFHDQDSYGLKELRKSGVEVFIISEDERVNRVWAEHQQIPFVLSEDKVKTIMDLLKRKEYSPIQAVFIGDEIRDMEAMKLVKYSMAPQNAAKDVKNIAWRTLQRFGGQGAVREAVEIIIKINSGDPIAE